MAKTSEIINLSFLLDNEKEIILGVLQKDENLRKREEKRIRKLKNELLEIRRKGGTRRHKHQQQSERVCVRCQKSLGLIFDRGDVCEECQLRVCKECRVVLENSKWKCTICAKILQLRVVTGEWFYEERSKRFMQGISQGSEVVKQSIARAPPGKSKDEKVNLKAQSDQNGQERSVTPTSTRSALRNVIDASRHRGLRAEKKGSRLTLGNGNNLDLKPEDSRSIGSASDLDAHSVHSTHSASRSARGGTVALESSGMQTIPNNLRSSAPGKSPTLSKRSAASGYSRRADGAESVASFHCSESFTDNKSNRNHTKSYAAPSIAISRASLSSDRSRSELDISGPYREMNEDSISIRSKSVPDDLNDSLEEDDLDRMMALNPPSSRGSLIGGISTAVQSDSERKWSYLNVPDCDGETTSLNSMMSVYSETGDYGDVSISGEILLNITYNYKTGALNILVKECRNLAIADEKKQKTDPYVKAYLLPDKSRQSKRKTKLKANTTNPVYNETLKYVISHSQLETRTLQLSVWHYDRFGHNSFLGEVEIPFESWEFENQTEEWFALQPKADSMADAVLQYKGELRVAMRFIPPERNLTLPPEQFQAKKSFMKGKKGNTQLPTGGVVEVQIKEAKNLTAVKSGGTSDAFVKGYMLPDNSKSSKHKTPVVKKSVNPSWNHTFTYSGLQPNDLNNVCLELTVWDKESLSSNVFLGGVRLNIGTGLSYGNEVDWMDSQGEEQHLWQCMLDQPEAFVESTLMLRSSMGKRKL
ncbi:synaptotagmin-like protein 5 isoform X1 [Acipenser ruthenus]|uniref:synaptotagmin-like protein 5 isoform X1 n=1 Tax=Acipenser ruthenus TaxID=7906 RepID=UPI002740A45F|nr:synaptotagmin-like protein 5 isoform X1 [Acipenser ruthenus]XP_058886075.1 synaptotagmin-like protein 5 isoform X1 [Acipenser ruthenus]